MSSTLQNPAWNNIILALAKQIISNLILSEEEEKILPCFGKNYSAEPKHLQRTLTKTGIFCTAFILVNCACLFWGLREGVHHSVLNHVTTDEMSLK